MKRKIAVVTGSRAEFGILEPLLKKICSNRALELKLIITGMHLLQKYGLTINEIKKRKFHIASVIKMYLGKENDPTYHSRALAQGIEGFGYVLSKMRPDILVVFGDRLEALAATLAASTLGVAIAHIHGGDRTDSGHIDEGIRHAITRFAHIHFTATQGHRMRLIKMGEEKHRIFNVGALGLDSILQQKPIRKELLFGNLKINFKEKVIICVFHPVNLEKETIGRQMREILEAIKELRIQTIIIYPNNDFGSQDIISEVKKYRNLVFLKVFPTLEHFEYINLLRYSNLLIGNSSSGIIEAASLKIPVVNIGSRNVGREHSTNILFVPPKKYKIIEAIRCGLYSNKFKVIVGKCRNPYGDGKASSRITSILYRIKIDRNLLRKKISY
jgi:UDP-hydrolysing UDP-N-acetyl-D-glucosamine 2-epimerase